MTDTLIRRLEEATEGSRELDARIGAEIRYFSDKAEDWMRGWQGPIAPYHEKPGHIACWHTDGRMSVWWSVPCYTTSIDAALTLVPEGWDDVQLFIKKNGCKARLKRRRGALLVAPMESERPDRLVATPAVALVIAALRARGIDMEG